MRVSKIELLNRLDYLVTLSYKVISSLLPEYRACFFDYENIVETRRRLLMISQIHVTIRATIS